MPSRMPSLQPSTRDTASGPVPSARWKSAMRAACRPHLGPVASFCRSAAAAGGTRPGSIAASAVAAAGRQSASPCGSSRSRRSPWARRPRSSSSRAARARRGSSGASPARAATANGPSEASTSRATASATGSSSANSPAASACAASASSPLPLRRRQRRRHQPVVGEIPVCDDAAHAGPTEGCQSVARGDVVQHPRRRRDARCGQRAHCARSTTTPPPDKKPPPRRKEPRRSALSLAGQQSLRSCATSTSLRSARGSLTVS